MVMSNSNGVTANQAEINQLEVDLRRRQMAIMARLRLLGGEGFKGLTHDGDRDTWSVFGWKQTLNYEDFLEQYKRGIGGRIVDLPATDTWKQPPQVSEDGDTDTAFVEAVNGLIKRLEMWTRFTQADKLAGIGQFSIIIIGIRDVVTVDDTIEAAPLSSPVNDPSVSSPDDILYLRPFSQDAVMSITLDTNPQSPRFGMPESYKINTSTVSTISSRDDSQTILIESGGTQIIDVHWSRVLHVVRDPVISDVLGEPALQRPFNTLQGVYTGIGAAVEAYWQVAWGGLAFKTQEGYKMGPDDKEELETEIDEYQNQWRRYMRLQGVDVEQLGSADVDPTGMMQSLFTLLAGESSIPLRMLVGSERGELASSQDERNWASQVSARQTSFAEPLVRDFVDRLIASGAVPAPEGGEYDLGNKEADGTFDWPSIFEQSEKDKADTANTRSSALKTSQDARLLGADVSRDEVRGYGGLTSPETDEDEEIEPMTPDEMLEEALQGITDPSELFGAPTSS